MSEHDQDICTCGHPREEHFDGGGYCEIAVECEDDSDYDFEDCSCQFFYLDEEPGS